jgi:hypothetical protein
MSTGTAGARILHVVPGRVRFHLPGWSEGDRERIEDRFRQVAGVKQVRADALTGNVLIRFDPNATSVTTLLAVDGPTAVRPPQDERTALPAAAPVKVAPTLPRLASGTVGLVSVLAVYRRVGGRVAGGTWLDVAKLFLQLGTLLTGAFAVPQVQFVVGGAETVLRLGALLGRRAA